MLEYLRFGITSSAGGWLESYLATGVKLGSEEAC
jgi:hypothetical protein